MAPIEEQGRTRNPVWIAIVGPLAAAGIAIAVVLSARTAMRMWTGWRADRKARGSVADVAVNKRRSAGIEDVGERTGDDLTVIEGIGPRMEAALRHGGIETYRQLAETSSGRLTTILREAGGRLANTTTWPEQARLAADGHWQELRDLQASLKSGKRLH